MESITTQEISAVYLTNPLNQTNNRSLTPGSVKQYPMTQSLIKPVGRMFYLQRCGLHQLRPRDARFSNRRSRTRRSVDTIHSINENPFEDSNATTSDPGSILNPQIKAPGTARFRHSTGKLVRVGDFVRIKTMTNKSPLMFSLSLPLTAMALVT